MGMETQGGRGQAARRTNVRGLGWLALALLLVSGCQEPEAEPVFGVREEAWPAAQGPGKRIVTDHWDIRTTVRDGEFLDLLPQFLETSYGQYEKLFPNTKETDAQPIVVYLFQTRQEWDAFSYKLSPRNARIYRRIRSGAYCKEDTVVAYYIRRAYTLSLLAHEGLHAFVFRRFPGDLPAWLNEGLATYCEGYHYGLSRPKFTPDRNEFRLNSLRDSLLADNLVPLRRLLGTNSARIVRDTSPTVLSYYAQVWGLVVFLRYGEHGKYAERFDALLNDLGTERLRVGVGAYVAATRTEDGQPIDFGEALFRKYITDDLDTFEAEYKKYLYEVASLR
jgi:hypothetical protein